MTPVVYRTPSRPGDVGVLALGPAVYAFQEVLPRPDSGRGWVVWRAGVSRVYAVADDGRTAFCECLSWLRFDRCRHIEMIRGYVATEGVLCCTPGTGGPGGG